MKVKALARSDAGTVRANSGDLRLQHRNLNPTYHPHRRAREYTRAVQSAKLDRMFAKPFVGSLGNGHRDAVSCAATSRTSLTPFVSGGVDGEVRVWDLQVRREVREIPTAHVGQVSGVVMMKELGDVLSCGYDGKVRQWRMMETNNSSNNQNNFDTLENDNHQPLSSWVSHGGPFKSIDYHWTSHQFATACDGSVDIWCPERSEPTQSFDPSKLGWGEDSVNVVRYNPAEACLIAHCSSDCSPHTCWISRRSPTMKI